MRPEPDENERVLRALVSSAGALTAGGQPRTSGNTLEQRLDTLTRAALINVPGADLVGLTMRSADDGLTSYGQTDADVDQLDRLQVSLGEGPCLDAIAEGSTQIVEVEDFAEATDRWARFAAAATERGVRSLVSFAMAPTGSPPGAINIYSRTPRAFDRTATMIAGLFATQAGIVIFGERRVADLEHAVQTRDVIGQAKGILMERHGIDAAEAFDRLVHASQTTNLKLVEIARWISGEVARPDSRPHR